MEQRYSIETLVSVCLIVFIVCFSLTSYLADKYIMQPRREALKLNESFENKCYMLGVEVECSGLINVSLEVEK